MKYTLGRPCKRCPFRSDIAPYLHAERAQEIAHALRAGGTFTCHETTVPAPESDEDELGSDMMDGPKAQMCAGAMATMEREDQPNQMMRVAERLGLYDAERLRSAKLPVHDSLSAWVNSHRTVPTVTDPFSGEELEFQHCDVVGDDCEDPPGYMGFGGVMHSDDEPMCNPLEDCQVCGHNMCPSCRADVDDERLCIYCNEEASDDS